MNIVIANCAKTDMYIDIPELGLVVTNLANDEKYDFCIYQKDDRNIIVSMKPNGELEFMNVKSECRKNRSRMTKKFALELFDKLFRKRIDIIDKILNGK